MKIKSVFFALLVVCYATVEAGVTDIATLPLLNIKGTNSVKPNLMLVYDDSGSMDFNFTPDIVAYATPSNTWSYACRAAAKYSGGRKICEQGDPAFSSADFNKQYYNPAFSYRPPVNADGTDFNLASYGVGSNWKKVVTDAFLETTTIDLTSEFPDLNWCYDASNSYCKTNKGGTTDTYPDDTYRNARKTTGNPYYYTIAVAEYCSDAALTKCKTTDVNAAAPNGFPYPAKLRWCKDTALSTATCQAKMDAAHIYPRFSSATRLSEVGTHAIFTRVDIVKATASYPKAAGRTDCKGANSCSYDEEMTNFASWYTFYRKRNQMMKTAVGRAFAPLTSAYKVGLARMQAASIDSGTSTDAGSGLTTTTNENITLLPKEFSGTGDTDNRFVWYKQLYATTASGGTPLRKAVHNVGKMFKNNSAIVEYPCQQNFMFVTTDGMWNGDAASDVTSDNDKAESATRFCSKAKGCVDPNTATGNSLADIALYWYNGGANPPADGAAASSGTVSLNPGQESAAAMLKLGQVPAAKDENSHLHINTYTLGLGVDGAMTYEQNYDSNPASGGDFAKLIAGTSTGCPWNGGNAYVWPDPKTDDAASNGFPSRVDDLWHAAINGHGKYFAASDPDLVGKSLSSALEKIQVTVGAAAAAATSTPNISQSDNNIFSDTFTTVKWTGELTDQKIDPATGNITPKPVWSTSDKIGAHVFANKDDRKIYMQDVGASNLKSFTYTAMSALEKGWFDNQCTQLSQCGTMTGAQKLTANDGTNLVNWLRGQQQYANDTIFRAYFLTETTPAGASAPVPVVLGDIASSKPAFLRDTRKDYAMTGFGAYKVGNQKRAAVVFVAANDGMLHAFDALTGEENWAYVPRISMPKLAVQASANYGSHHQFSTDGSPELADVQIGGSWKTILVAGMNGGGRGYYALDVSDPSKAPTSLWELCADSALCTKANDPDIGLTFGNPQFGMWNGKWVVFLTSGYNNVPGTAGVASGDGKGYLYIVDVATGSILKKISTGSGSTDTPSGLAKITSISLNPSTDPVTTYVYGGDNQGQMWRFDLTDKNATPAVKVVKMADTGAAHPITARPDVSTCRVQVDGAAALRRVVVFGTGRMLGLTDLAPTTEVQSMYLIKDADDVEGNPIGNIRGSSMVKQTLNKDGQADFTLTSNAVDLATKNGWYLDFSLNAGERMNLDPKIVAASVVGVTNIPGESSACSVGGSSNRYQVGLCTGAALSLVRDGTDGTGNSSVFKKTNVDGTISPKDATGHVGSVLAPVTATVGFIVVRLPSGAVMMISDLADGRKVNNKLETNSGGVNPAKKGGWRRVTN
ncbi:MAG: PilC/PilY family type IV pilus protein [Pseudomonadota bacterium]